MTNCVLLSIPSSPWISSVYVLGLVYKDIGCGILSKPEHLVQLWFGSKQYLACASKWVGFPSSLRARRGPRGPVKANWISHCRGKLEGKGKQARRAWISTFAPKWGESSFPQVVLQAHLPQMQCLGFCIYKEDDKGFVWSLSWYCGSIFVSDSKFAGFHGGNKTKRSVLVGVLWQRQAGQEASALDLFIPVEVFFCMSSLWSRHSHERQRGPEGHWSKPYWMFPRRWTE